MGNDGGDVMKKIVFWYRKMEPGTGDQILASLLKINFMTNLLIFLGL